jgi:hypothetical protein
MDRRPLVPHDLEGQISPYDGRDDGFREGVPARARRQRHIKTVTDGDGHLNNQPRRI